MKEAAYKSMVHPVLECGNSVLDPHYDSLNDELEKVQKRAATLKDFKNAKKLKFIKFTNFLCINFI